MLKTQAIKNLLLLKTHNDLALLYNANMEVQVNVAQDQGTQVVGDYQGKRWIGYSDGATTWKPFRIPYRANTDPTYNDVDISFDIAEHAEGIGMTGWNWKEQRSYWVAFDFDAMFGHAESHAKKLSIEELTEIQEIVKKIPWVEIRKSTSGTGLHLYVKLEPVPTATHTEHAALARSILSMMSAIAGFNFASKVDTCGGNMWVWHRKMKGTDGLKLIKPGVKLTEIPHNWKDHVNVIARKSRKANPTFLETKENNESFESLTNQYNHIPLDDEHKKLIDYLIVNKLCWWWQPDYHMLVTHTASLKDAHAALSMKGVFETVSQGTDQNNDHNCFCFPLRNGAWSVRRYGETSEKNTWDKDQKGFTYCYLNKSLDLKTSCKIYGGVEDEKSGWAFREAEMVELAILKLGYDLKLPNWIKKRPAKIKPLKEANKIVIHIEHQASDSFPDMVGWHAEKKLWRKVIYLNLPDTNEIENVEDYDEIVRHVVTSNEEDAGWRLKIGDSWRKEPYVNIRLVMKGSDNNPKDIDLILSQCIKRGWKIVNLPFQGEYPGDRRWNMGNARLKIVPTQDIESVSFPTWQRVLDHCGESLNEALQHNEWAKANGVITGAMYLKLWIAALIKQPTKPSAYLCFWGDQNCGKSTYHEAISELLISGGHMRADISLTSGSAFNGELENKILCIVEEVDLRKNEAAYNRIKDWVTSPEITLHIKGATPYMIQNYTHWIQCANDRSYCPVFSGDTRITLMHVQPLDPSVLVGRDELKARLKKEAPDFLASVLATEIPENNDRLLIPVINTRDKTDAQEGNMNALELFLKDYCFYIPGAAVTISDFHEKFVGQLSQDEADKWSKQKISKSLPSKFVKGRNTKMLNLPHCYGNLSFDSTTPPGKLLYVNHSGYLRERY